MAPWHCRFQMVALLAATTLVVAGCGEKQKSVRELVAESAKLPGARTSQNAELRTEIERITAEGGTPEQLGENLLPDDQNVAAALATIFDSTLLPSILATANEFYPSGRFAFSAAELRRAIAFRDSHQRQLDAIYQALARPACNFAVEFDKGFFFEDEFTDEVTLSCRLLAFDAAAKKRNDGPAAAIESVDRLFRLIGHLGNGKLLSARSQAANLRADALRVLEAVALHDDTSGDDLKSLFRILQSQLDNWPSDADSLVGERAMVLHSYEAIRAGLLPWILTNEEKQKFKSERILETLDAALRETADMDEVFYLNAMRRMIEVCDKPYYERLGVYIQLTEDIHASQSTPNFPFAAARLFLPDLEARQEQLALDRARCEAWALALAAAADLPAPPYSINPHNGEPYKIARESQRVAISLDEPDVEDVVVPLPKP